MTRAEQVSEYLKCKNNVIYFITTYCMIELAGGDIPFPLYGKQKELIRDIIKFHNICVLKSRQTGISTTLQGLACWLVTFHDNIKVGILSKDGAEATAFARSIRTLVEKLPVWMNPKFSKYTEQTFSLKNGSMVISSTVNPIEPTKTLRGKSLSWLIIDEAAFINRMDIAWESLVPAISTAQKAARDAKMPYGTIIVSTPNKTTGMGAWYFKKYQSAILNSENDINEIGKFRSFVVYWKDIKELANDPTWYQAQCNFFEGDQRKIKQELELHFLPTTGSFFEENTCSQLQENTRNIEPKQILKLFNGEVWVFDDPKPNKHYLIGIDTASEYGNDRSAITIWDYETLDQVWEYQGKIPVTDFEKVVDYACAQYTGTVVVERNSYGNQIVEHIERGNFYTSMYKQKVGEQLKTGLTTDLKTRPLMIDALYSYVSQYPQMVKSKRLAIELIGLVTKKNGKVEADSGCNDDLALTLSFCAYVRKYDPPLMLELEKGHDTILEGVLSMNYDRMFFKDSLEESPSLADMNAKIMKHTKEEVTSFTDSFVNVMSFYNK